MALPSSGALSLLDIAGEFGGSTPHSLNEYYGVASGVPTSGTISIDDFYGTSNTVVTSLRSATEHSDQTVGSTASFNNPANVYDGNLNTYADMSTTESDSLDSARANFAFYPAIDASEILNVRIKGVGQGGSDNAVTNIGEKPSAETSAPFPGFFKDIGLKWSGPDYSGGGTTKATIDTGLINTDIASTTYPEYDIDMSAVVGSDADVLEWWGTTAHFSVSFSSKSTITSGRVFELQIQVEYVPA